MKDLEEKINELEQIINHHNRIHMIAIDNKFKKINRIMKSVKVIHKELAKLLKDFEGLDNYETTPVNFMSDVMGYVGINKNLRSQGKKINLD